MMRYLRIIFILLLAIGGVAWFGKGFFQNLINQYFPFQAAVIETLPPEPEGIIPPEIEPEEETIEGDSEEETLSDSEINLPHGGPSPPQDLIEIQDEIDEIAERIDILSQEIAELIEERQSPPEEIEEPEEDEEEIEEEEPEEEEDDEIEELEEKEVGQKVGQEPCETILGIQPTQNKVIINEIAWMGSFSSANDEWIEIKNISDNEINLTSWQILDKDNQIKIILSGGGPASVKLPAGGFYFLERTNDSSVPNILADFIYKGALSDKDEALFLFDENCQLQDRVEADPNWPAGKKSERKTMERGENFAWHTFNGIAQDSIFGTPKRENSQPEIFIPGGGGVPTPPPLPEPELCSQKNLSEPIYEPVIFNEIAWMGTLADWRNEWLELKNISEEDISLDGWQILDKDEEIKIILSGTVPVMDFYLLERTDDNSLPNIIADQIYTGNLEDNNESLRLFDQDCNLIDEVLADPDWPSGSKKERRSMERKKDFGWQNYFGEGEDNIMGTPKKENSQPKESKDETPPLVIFDDISSLQINSEFTISWQGQDPEDTATPSGIDGFLLRYSEDKENWDYFPAENEYTTETQYNFSGENEYTYYFQIQAKDKAGNESEWIEMTIEINALPVVINEIAWMGTTESHTSEWIELFNNANSEISLEGWLLKAVDGTPEINLAETISGKGFYLLERTDDDTLPDILADQIYTGALNNTGEKLELHGLDNQLIDEVICKEDEGGECLEWLVGDNETKQTMERKNPCLQGGNIENWGMSQEPGGTPKAQNSNYE